MMLRPLARKSNPKNTTMRLTKAMRTKTADCRIMIPGTSPGWTSQRTPSVPDSGRGSARQQPVQ